MIFSKTFIKKTITIAIAFIFIAFIVFFSLPKVQSRFNISKHGAYLIILDKYIPEQLQKNVLQNIQDDTVNFMMSIDFINSKPDNTPSAFLLAYNNYGVLVANDALLKKYINRNVSSDLRLIKNIGFNYYANEPVCNSITSQDGAYVFAYADDTWQESIIHGYAHSIAIRNAPSFVKTILSNNQDFDPYIKNSFLFIDEVFALCTSDIYKLSKSNTIKNAFDSFPYATALYYNNPDAEFKKKYKNQVDITGIEMHKSIDFYIACNEFASWLIINYGQQTLCSIAKLFYSGNYTSFDNLFNEIGGFSKNISSLKDMLQIK